MKKGYKRSPYSKKWRENMSNVRKGKHYSPKTEFQKGHKMNIGKKHPGVGGRKKGCIPWNKGLSYKITEKQLKQISELGKKQRGENNNNWQGGKSFEPYGKEFKPLREKIRQRDGHRCQECFRCQDELRTKNNKPYRLIVHHIDFNKKNNQENNLISLCRKCHLQTNYNRENWTNYFKNKII